MIRKQIPLFLFILLLSSCSPEVDFGGFFSSYSDPDTRFALKDSLLPHSDPSPLQTIPLSGGKLCYSFSVIADIHIKNDEAPDLREFIDNELDPGDRFILDCGDTTQSGSAEQYTTYKTIMDSIGIPWFQTIGNHDLYFEGWKNYSSIIGQSVYSFPVGNIGESGSMYVIALDSGNSTLGKMQMDWLEDTLKEQSGLWNHIVVFTHSQFFSTGIDTVVQFTDSQEIYKLMYLFKTYGVDYIFMGHNHKWDYRTFNGVQYITLEPLQKENSGDSYVRVEVDGNDISFRKIMIP